MTASQFVDGLLIAAHVLLSLFGVVRWRQLDAGCRYTWAWAFLGLIARLIPKGFDDVTVRLVVAHFYYPVSVLLATAALATYQSTRRAADAVRLAGLGYLVAWSIITPLFEELREFSRYTAPLRAMLITVIAARTIRRPLGTLVRASEDRGILIAAAFAVLYAATGIVAPFAAASHPGNDTAIRIGLLRPLLFWRDFIILLSMLPMMWAFMLHVPVPDRKG